MIFALLFLGSIANEAWADYKVTYHILTLPLDHTAGTANTNAAYDGKRIEAIKAIAVNPAKVKDLPDHFKSPLAKNFTYWDAADVTKSANAELIYPNHNKTKHFLYEIRAGATPLNEETALSENRDIFVTYEYNPDNGIAKLDGTESYNIAIGNGFLAYNKGRNNRMAVIPANKVSGEQLASEQFVKIDVKGTDISAWWSGNLTPQATAESYFHLLFKYIGEDPYNITIVSAFEGSDYYIEQYGSSESKPVNKYYEGSSLFARYDKTSQSDELLIASDDNKKYKTENNKTNYTSVVESDPKPGYYRNLSTAIWNSFAMLNNTNGSGYVFMGTRCVNGSGILVDTCVHSLCL